MKVIWTDYIELLKNEKSYRIKGTSIDPSNVIHLVQKQQDIDQILNSNPELTRDHIQACIAFSGHQQALGLFISIVNRDGHDS